MNDADTIESIGGPSFIARHITETLGPISPQAVSQWKTDGIPLPWRAHLAQTWPDKAAHLIPVKEVA